MSELETAQLEGELYLAREEIATLQGQVQFFAAEQDFWRRKYLREHPELDTWDYAFNAREAEEGDEHWR